VKGKVKEKNATRSSEGKQEEPSLATGAGVGQKLAWEKSDSAGKAPCH